MHYDAARYVPQESIGFLMSQALTALRARIDEALATHDLTAMQWQVMVKVGSKAAVTCAELAHALNQDAAGITRMLDRLEAKGLMQRTRSVADRRVVELTVTPRGKRLLPELSARAVEVLNHALNDFSTDDVQVLKALLRRIPANLETPLP